MKHLNKLNWAVLLLMVLTLAYSCKKDSKTEVIASFTYVQDATNFKLVKFTNTSTGYSTVSWDFGDGSAASTTVSPEHTYAAAGEYTVKLTAVNGGSSDVYTQKITLTDPNALLTSLADDGTGSKTWKLLRDVSSGRYPLEVGPADYSQIWWAFGKGNDLALRTCLLNDEWKFSRDGLKMDFDAKGDYWAEGGVFVPAEICASTSSMLGPNGEDLSAWGNGSHTFVLTPGTTQTLQVVGLGAYLGLCKAATGAEVKVPQESVTYQVIKLYDGDVDTLIVQTAYQTTDDPPKDAYWRFTLVHYDDPSQEPPMPGPKPTASFDYTAAGLTITCTNNSTDAVSYLWSFGDGTTSTETSPTHTYAGDGIFAIRLTATNPNGSTTTAKDYYYSTTDLTALTEAMLVGGAWKVRAEDNSIFVGPGVGVGGWWSVPIGFLTGEGVGGDDWSCITDDLFTFKAAGVYSYATNGYARNDGYFGSPNGCIDDATIAGSGNGAAFGSGDHTFTFTPATGTTRPIITLTNGAGKAAFIGFLKGYNGIASGVAGGENTNNANPPNGGSATNTYEVTFYSKSATKEYIVISVDYTAAHDGSMGWTTILER